MSTSDLTKATRELFVRSLKDEVAMATPVWEELQRRNQVTYSGGTSIKRLVDTDTMEDLVQEYSANDALTDEKKTTLQKPEFTWKLAQMPLRYDVDEYLQNITAGKEEQLLDLAQFLTTKGQQAVKRKMDQLMWNSGSVTPILAASKSFESIISALNHDTAYGTLSRSFSAGTNDWWQGADPAGLGEVVTSSSQDTATNLTISNLRKWINESSIAHHMLTPSDLNVYMCPTLFNKLRAEMESKLIYKEPTGDGSVDQKLLKMKLDKHTIVSVPYLQTSSTMKTWVVIMNMADWELRIHTERNFKMTDFKWQGDQSNGYDYWLARILWSGNLVCWKPNGSMWLSAVS